MPTKKTYDCRSCYDSKKVKCEKCAGSGRKKGDSCFECDGGGRNVCAACNGAGLVSCLKCHGDGMYGRSRCASCDGKKVVPCAPCGGKKTTACARCGGRGRLATGAGACDMCQGRRRLDCPDCTMGGTSRLSFKKLVTEEEKQARISQIENQIAALQREMAQVRAIKAFKHTARAMRSYMMLDDEQKAQVKKIRQRLLADNGEAYYRGMSKEDRKMVESVRFLRELVRHLGHTR